MHVGTISKLFPDDQYGKIKTSAGVEVHFHRGCLWNTRFADLMEGQRVEFEIEPAHKGYRAFHIRQEENAPVTRSG